jgi:hypothetical protein
MDRHRTWTTPTALGLAGLAVAGVLAPAEAGQRRATLMVQVRVSSPCTSSLRDGVVEQRCATRTPASARIEPPAVGAGLAPEVPLTTLSTAGPGPSYITVIY